MNTLLVVVLIIVFLVWFKELSMAARQRTLTKSLLAVVKRADVILQDNLCKCEGTVAAASLKLLEIATPRMWLRRNIEAARTVLASLGGDTNQFTADDNATMAHLLDSEQTLLARRRVAFERNPCFHYGNGSAAKQKLIKQILYYERHGHGHYGIARVWCRHCLVSWEQQWEIAVSGGR